MGQIIAGKYRIDRAIGAGGMGTVVAATHLQLGTQLALKFLNEKIKQSANSLERFTREARACAQLRSEHVCRVSDFGIEDNTPYIAMDLLAGVDLARLIQAGRVDTAIAVDFVIQACTGLAEAHALGIVHRDLKPGNLFLTRRPDGMPLIKVLDFGVAKIPVEDDDHALTRTAHIVGSPGYMAPEQLRSSKTVDQRADVWALGVILYELISARHPFFAAAMTEVALKIAMDEPAPLVEAPEAVRTIVMRCLAKEPEDRFRDVNELAAALAPFAHHDRVAGAAAMRALVETAERVDPMAATKTSNEGAEATKQETAGPTRVETPRGIRPESTQYGAAAVIERPSRRRYLAWFVGGAVVAGVGGAIIASQSPDPDQPIAAPDAAPIALLPDTATANARVMLEIKVAGVPTGTILVDEVVWGEGTRLSVPVIAGKHRIEVRAANREPVIEEHVLTTDKSITITFLAGVTNPWSQPRRDPIAASGRPARTPTPLRAPEPVTAGSDQPPGPASTPKPGDGAGSNQPPAPGSGSGSGSPSPVPSVTVDPEEAAEAELTAFRGTLLRRGLQLDDLGVDGARLTNELSRAHRVKDWITVRHAAAQLNVIANNLKIDGPLISAKQARLTAKLQRSSEAVRKSFEQLMAEVVILFNAGDFAGANRRLNIAFDRFPAHSRPPERNP
ncbi:MAG: serine/threonine protein kinase, partial [Deltaproteobacteria bacterium]|nr:serine/threonine protein kinase [Deltaproteobacteria bacterium]